MMKIIYLTAMTAALLFISVTNASALDLFDIYQHALKNDSKYQQQVYTNEANRELVPQSRSSLLPDLNATGDYAWRSEERDQIVEDDEQLSTVHSEGNYSSQRARLVLSQVLFDRRAWLEFKQAQSTFLVSENRLEDEYQAMVFRVIQAYFNALNKIDLVEVGINELAAFHEHQLLTEQRYKEKLGTLTDVLESQSRSLFSEANLIRARAEKENAMNELEELSGLSNMEINPLVKSYEPEILSDKDDETWHQAGSNGALSILIARQELKSTELEIKKNRSKFLPDLKLEASSFVDGNELNPVTIQKDFRRDEVAVRLNIPLFKGLRTRAEVNEAMRRLDAANESLKVAQKDTTKRVSNDLNSVKASYQSFIALKESYMKSDKALQLRKQGFLEGLSSNLDLLRSYQDVYRTERDWINASYRYILDRATLFRDVGGLSEEIVEAMNSFVE
ncbi:MAG: TolC family protein [Arenicellales bacterium]